jgi:hypothetical protein
MVVQQEPEAPAQAGPPAECRVWPSQGRQRMAFEPPILCFFIATFMADHIAHHAQHLHAE